MASQPVKEVTLTRILNAPRELVFEVWTNEKHIAAWWGPRGFTVPLCKLDVRPGGDILIHMARPGGGEVSPITGKFYEIDAPNRLVFFAMGFEKEDGRFGIENMITLTFEDAGNGQTKLTTHVAVVSYTPDMLEAIEGMDRGWGESLDKMVEYAESR